MPKPLLTMLVLGFLVALPIAQQRPQVPLSGQAGTIAVEDRWRTFGKPWPRFLKETDKNSWA